MADPHADRLPRGDLLVEAQGRKAAVRVAVEADGVGRLERDVEAGVYFCVLEALNNVAKSIELQTVAFIGAECRRGVKRRYRRLRDGASEDEKQPEPRQHFMTASERGAHHDGASGPCLVDRFDARSRSCASFYAVMATVTAAT